MEKRNFKLQLTEDMITEVQALGAEVDARVHLIDAMFENHKNDPDDSVFTSPAFVSYQKGLTEYKKKYENAVRALGDKIIPMVQEYLGEEDVTFDWNIDDFSKLEVDITLK